MPERSTPKYDELTLIEATGDRHCWGVFGEGDELGTLNLLTPELVLQAAWLVRKGKVFNLSLPLNQPDPPLVPNRESYRHEVTAANRNTRDDKLDNLYLQASSQWDSFRHIRYREFGYYNGFQDDDTERGALGIDRWADHGIVGRGVLVDVPRYFQQKGIAYDPWAGTPLDEAAIADVLSTQGVATREGDILLLRTGWMERYLRSSAEERANVPRSGHLPVCSGLVASREMAAFLWDRGFAAIAADNLAIENTPGDPEVGFLHRRILPLLGIPLGELWDFERLAEDCVSDGVYESMLVSVPLNLPKAVGSPANAIALK